jgi:hypothetical protein
VSEAKPIFEVIEWKIGGGFYVKATLPNNEPQNIDSFATRNDALRWIRNDSQLWLYSQRQGLGIFKKVG